MGEPAERDELAATFRHPGVASAYRHRAPYPAEVFDILDRELMTAGEAAAFGHAVEDLVRPYAVDGVLDLPAAAELAWGRITVTAGR